MNNAYPTGRNGRRYKSKKFVMWEREFNYWALSNHPAIVRARTEFSIPKPRHIVFIQSDFHFPHSEILCLDGKPKRNDTSNRLKILHDAVSGAIWLDDAWFFDGGFSKQPLINKNNTVGYADVALEWRPMGWINP